MSFLLNGLWRLADLVGWVPSATSAAVARWYNGTVESLAKLVSWGGQGEKPKDETAPTEAAAAAATTEPAAPAPEGVMPGNIEDSTKSVVVMLTQKEGDDVAVKGAYLLFYGATGAIVGAMKLVAHGACLGYCMAKAGIKKIAGLESGIAHPELLENAPLEQPPGVFDTTFGGDDQVMLSTVAVGDYSVLDPVEDHSNTTTVGFGLGPVPKKEAPRDQAEPEFVCYNLEGNADEQLATFERSLCAEMPKGSTIIEVPDTDVQNCIMRNSHIMLPDSREVPTAPRPSQLPSSTFESPLGNMTLQQFLDDCRNNPVPGQYRRDPNQPMRHTIIDLVSLMYPEIDPSLPPIITSNDIVSGWVLLE